MADHGRVLAVRPPIPSALYRQNVAVLLKGRRGVLRGNQVPPEEGLARTELEVEPGDGLRVVLLDRRRVLDLSAAIGRGGQELRDGLRDRAHQGWIHPVVHERGAKRDLAAGIAGGRRAFGEVAVQHRGGRDPRDVVGRRLFRQCALVAAEEEQLVTDDRTTERPPELIPHETIVGSLAVGSDRREAAGGVEAVMAREFERAAGEAVRAGFRHGIDRCAGMHPAFSGQPAGGHLKFLERIRERKREIPVVVHIVVQGAVQCEAHTGAETTRNRDRDGIRAAACVRHRTRVHRGPGQHDQIGDLAALERELDDAFLLHHFGHAGALHVHEGCRGFHGDRLFETANRELDVEHRCGPDLQDDAGSCEGAEALELGFQPIGTGDEVRHRVGAVLVGHDRAGEAGVGLRDGDRHAGQHGAAFVPDQPADLGGALCPHIGGNDEEKDAEGEVA